MLDSTDGTEIIDGIVGTDLIPTTDLIITTLVDIVLTLMPEDTMERIAFMAEVDSVELIAHHHMEAEVDLHTATSKLHQIIHLHIEEQEEEVAKEHLEQTQEVEHISMLQEE